MTRQKRELRRKIDALQTSINLAGAFGCYPPAEWYEDIYIEMEELLEKLANLSHFSTLDRYLWDYHGELADLR